MVYKITIQNEVLKYTKHTVHTSIFRNVDPQMLGATIKIYSQTSTGIFAPLFMTCLLASWTFPTETAENRVKLQKNFGRITQSGPRLQTSICPKSGLEFDPLSFHYTVLIDSHTAQCKVTYTPCRHSSLVCYGRKRSEQLWSFSGWIFVNNKVCL
jgi:hypothetical protein